jgi:caspase domain-containing protein
MTARLPDPDRSRAVLIGASRYADPELPALPAVRKNLDDLRDVLTSESGTGLPATHCTVVYDPADPASAGKALRQAAREADDLLLVYYAGHGLIWSRSNELYLAMTGTDGEEVGTSALRYAEVRETFMSSTARTKVLILDCCFAGRAIGTMSNAANALLGRVDVEGVYILTATEPNQLAHAPDGSRNTVFTGELLQILRDGLPGEGQLITMDLLYRNLLSRMRRKGLPEPSCANEKTAAHLALARNEAIPDEHDPRNSLRAGIDELAIAEERTRQLRERVLDRIANPGLAPFVEEATTLRDRFNAAGRQDIDEHAALELAVAQATLRTRHAHELAAGLLERRDELRGRLDGYLALAVRLGDAEEADVATSYTTAFQLLWTKPCDLRAATRAVLTFQQCVTDRMGSST